MKKQPEVIFFKKGSLFHKIMMIFFKSYIPVCLIALFLLQIGYTHNLKYYFSLYIITILFTLYILICFFIYDRYNFRERMIVVLFFSIPIYFYFFALFLVLGGIISIFDHNNKIQNAYVNYMKIHKPDYGYRSSMHWKNTYEYRILFSNGKQVVLHFMSKKDDFEEGNCIKIAASKNIFTVRVQFKEKLNIDNKKDCLSIK